MKHTSMSRVPREKSSFVDVDQGLHAKSRARSSNDAKILVAVERRGVQHPTPFPDWDVPELEWRGVGGAFSAPECEKKKN